DRAPLHDHVGGRRESGDGQSPLLLRTPFHRGANGNHPCPLDLPGGGVANRANRGRAASPRNEPTAFRLHPLTEGSPHPGSPGTTSAPGRRLPIAFAHSERDLVVSVVEALAEVPLAAVVGRRSAATESAAGAGGRGAVATPAEEDDLGGDDLGGPAALPVAVLPLAGLEAALHVALPPLAQVLAAELAELAPDDDAVPLGALLALAGRLVRPGVGGGEAEVRHRLPARREAHLGVGPQVPEQNHLVHACHRIAPCCRSART